MIIDKKKINRIVNRAKKNGNQITIDYIDSLCLEDDECAYLNEVLSASNIDIVTSSYEADQEDNTLRYQDGFCLNKAIKKIPVLENDEVIKILKLAKAGDITAKNKIIEANLKLVYRFAEKYKEKYPTVPLDDLVQEGTLALYSAIDAYNPCLNTNFSTYAVSWIFQKLKRCVETDRVVAIPSNMMVMVKKYIHMLIGI